MKSEELWKRIASALFDSDLIFARLTLALAEFCWAVMLLWPGETFSRPTYTYQSQVMGELAWALLFMLSAITQASIVLMQDQYSRFSQYFAAWNAVLWLFTVVSMLLSVYPPPAAIGGEMALAVTALWIFIRPYILAYIYERATRESAS